MEEGTWGKGKGGGRDGGGELSGGGVNGQGRSIRWGMHTYRDSCVRIITTWRDKVESMLRSGVVEGYIYIYERGSGCRATNA